MSLGWLTGCASSYVPRPGPRLSLVMDSGAIAYVREGRTYRGGVFGNQLVEAVEGNEKAEEYARSYQGGAVAGFALTLVGLTGALGGAALVGAEVNEAPNDPSHATAGWLVAGAGLVIELIGVAVSLSAVPHLYDAINAYNDGVETGTGSPRVRGAP